MLLLCDNKSPEVQNSLFVVDREGDEKLLLNKSTYMAREALVLAAFSIMPVSFDLTQDTTNAQVSMGRNAPYDSLPDNMPP